MQVFALAEGGADPFALLGLIRLVQNLALSKTFSPEDDCTLIIDSGTGTTAVGALSSLQISSLQFSPLQML